MSGEKPLSKLFSKEQREFFAAHAPSGLTIDDLSVLGPIFVLKLKLAPGAFSRRIVVEMWLYPDGSRILELSTKCLPDQALSVMVEVRKYLESLGIQTTGEQQTKTKTALEFFSSELQAQGRRPRPTQVAGPEEPLLQPLHHPTEGPEGRCWAIDSGPGTVRH